MSFLGIHLKTFTDDQWKNVVKPALASAGHDLEQFGEDEVTKLVAAAQAKYPALVAAFKTGFSDVEDSSLKGLAKMEKVVLDILPQVPAIAGELANLSNLKDFLVQLGQTVFTDTLTELKAEAGKLLDAIF